MVVELREAKGKKLEVFLDGEVYCKCYRKDLAVSGISDGFDGQQSECSQHQLTLLENEVFLPRAKRRALFLLEKKEYTEKELRKKLQTDGYPKSIVEAVTEYVKALHYVNDRSFAERYAFSLLSRHSEREIIQKMQQKGLDKELVKEALIAAKERYKEEFSYKSENEEGSTEEISLEQEAIRTFLRKKGYRPELTDGEKRKKFVMSLYRKGFLLSDIRAVLGEFDTTEELFD